MDRPIPIRATALPPLSPGFAARQFSRTRPGPWSKLRSSWPTQATPIGGSCQAADRVGLRRDVLISSDQWSQKNRPGGHRSALRQERASLPRRPSV